METCKSNRSSNNGICNGDDNTCMGSGAFRGAELPWNDISSAKDYRQRISGRIFAEAEMVTDVYSEIVDEDRRLNAKKLDEEFYDTLDTEEPEHNLHSEAQEPISDNDKLLLELLKSMTPEMKEKLLKETLSNC